MGDQAVTITVKLFALLRDRAGTSEVELQLADNARVRDAADAIGRQVPGIAAMLARVAFAVNQQYVPVDTQLHDGDELAVIPPVSGGAR